MDLGFQLFSLSKCRLPSISPVTIWRFGRTQLDYSQCDRITHGGIALPGYEYLRTTVESLDLFIHPVFITKICDTISLSVDLMFAAVHRRSELEPVSQSEEWCAATFPSRSHSRRFFDLQFDVAVPAYL